MRLSLPTLFPDIPQFKEVNLNEWLKAHCPVRPASPQAFQKEIDLLCAEMGAATYGGWMEYREWMWAGSYMSATEKYTHLGVDVYLHQGTRICLPFDVTVVDTFYDEDCEVGWGGRISVQREPGKPAIVLGHLSLELPPVGARIPAHSEIGRLATWPINGNVFEHLHIQLIRPALLPTFDWDSLDGYGFQEQATDFMHPFQTDV